MHLPLCRRTDNLQSRVDTKVANKKAAREKKLLRAGFEGRKTGFIGGGGKAAGGGAGGAAAAGGAGGSGGAAK